jgi:hypothetical protein
VCMAISFPGTPIANAGEDLITLVAMMRTRH